MLERIGHYRVHRKLGEGGMGVVYAAEDERLGRTVAIKMLRRDSADGPSRERLWREARAAASLTHPNVCQIYEVGEEHGELYIAMELLEGDSLAARIARGPLPAAEAARTAVAILGALDVLHRRGLVHRDLKPSNVFLTPHGVKLLDFGLARAIERGPQGSEMQLTMPGMVMGTPHYVAPEVLFGHPVDPRGDLFAMGAILYEMLTGRQAFTGKTVPEVFHAIMYDEPPVLGGSPGIASLDPIIHRALAKRPEDRFQTAEAMADALRSHQLALETTGELAVARPMARLIVLPFRVLRPDAETDFLAFSIPDALSSSLAGLDSLLVRSSLAASRIAGDQPDLGELAAKLGVDFVLTGTMLRAGDQLRVSTQLVEARGGALLWSQTSQVALGDVFQLQDGLTRRILESLQLPLSARDRGMLAHEAPRSARAYEFYLRANPLSYQPSNWTVARDLYLQCLELDPGYAPAWARLGRVYRVLALYSGEGSDEHYARAQEAFRKALELGPDLPVAHNLFTNLEVEMGRAQEAMLRLLGRARARSGDPELFAGLVQACRYCGLLEAAVAAYERARRLDPQIRTSVHHAYLMLGEWERAIETNVEEPPHMNALALNLLGRDAEAIALLRELEQGTGQRGLRLYIAAHRAVLEGAKEEARQAISELFRSTRPRDPCALYYGARLLARAGDTERAFALLRDTVEGGFYCYSFMVRDPWLDSLRASEPFRAVLRRAESRHREARAAFLEARGDRILNLERV